ncbi:MAG: EFR1 family ferrodoxin [Promethearchaeota archaeon]
MKVLVTFFSGTGNTQYVAEYIKDHLLARFPGPDFSVTLAALESAEPDTVLEYDLVFLGFPVYAGSPPPNVKGFLADLPRVKGKGVFVFNTKGFAEGVANWMALRRLRKKGFKPLGYASVRMPGSDGISMMEKDSRTFKKYLDRDFSTIKAVDAFVESASGTISKLLAGASIDDLPRKTPFKTFGFLLTGFIAALFKLFSGKFTRKLRADERCVRCGLCARQCPQHNITLEENRVVFGSNCILCLRCLNNCPEEAIQIGKMTVDKARWHGPDHHYEPLRYREPKQFP